MRFLEESESAKPFYSGHNTCLSASNPGTEFNLQNDSRGHKKQFLITVVQCALCPLLKTYLGN